MKPKERPTGYVVFCSKQPAHGKPSASLLSPEAELPQVKQAGDRQTKPIPSGTPDPKREPPTDYCLLQRRPMVWLAEDSSKKHVSLIHTRVV